jgi:hexosaminidase
MTSAAPGGPLPSAALFPRPQVLKIVGGVFDSGPHAGVRGPEPAAGLAREVLGLTGPGGEVEFRLTDDEGLGQEGYRLVVQPDRVMATAATTVGLGWAVQSLRQLQQDGMIPCVEIEDRPRLPWRGSLLDVARHYYPMSFLYRYVDLLTLHKLNVLHLHLTDDQGWRFQVQRYPRLTEVGSHRTASATSHAEDSPLDSVPHGGFYTQRELRALVAYGERRGLRIMPEIDTPGHVQAALAAYPQLGNEPNRTLSVRRHWGISRHVLNVSEYSVRFVCDVLDELSDVFPFEFVHIGGDEVPPDEWAVSSIAADRVAAEGLSGPEMLAGWWAGRLTTHLGGLGRRAAVWDETLDAGLSGDPLVFAWQGVHRLAQALAAGAQVVAAPYEFTYLDWREATNPDEPPAIAGDLPLPVVYGYRPPAGVLGLQGQLWSEYLPTPQTVEWRAFPRLIAVAENAWSDGPANYDDFRARLSVHLRRLDRMGVNYRPPDADAGRGDARPQEENDG